MSSTASPNERNLIWIDLEMTGLEPEADRIIEIATIVTDEQLNVLAQGPVLAVHQPESQLALMDEWNQTHHSRSGLLDRVRASKISEEEAEAQTLEFLSEWLVPGKSPMCGNSICQDRRFLALYMKKLEAFFHYRNLDVSTLKILAQRWKPSVADSFTKKGAHLALDDIIESIDELKHYREHLLKLS